MIILCDTRQQDKKHEAKEKWFVNHGIEIRRTKLYTGDYTLPADQSTCIDTKRNIDELCNNVCSTKKEHDRFKDELVRAQEADIRLIILVENENGIQSLTELHKWVNPRLLIRAPGGKQKYPKATRGVTLMKACMTMQHKYGCEFQFCTPDEAGQRIVEILTGEHDGIHKP